MAGAHVPPVDDAVDVEGLVEVYRTDEWWRAVVRYRPPGRDRDRRALYLWHNDGERWRRKQKYVIDDREAWETDRDLIDGLLTSDPADGRTDAFPTSDYLTIGRGETVYRSDGWWKAVVEIVRKGSYDTQEVAVYVWQAGETDDDWRRRQKYVAKARGWTDDVEAIQRSLGGEDEAPTADDASAGGAGGAGEDTLGALEDAIIDF